MAGRTFVFVKMFLFGLRRCAGRADTAMTVPLFMVGGGYDLPGADFADRFGPGPAAQAGLWLKLKRGWLLGFDYSFRFTGKIREGVLDSIRLPDAPQANQVVGSDGLLSDVRVTGRGYTLFASAGRVWPVRLPGAGGRRLGGGCGDRGGPPLPVR